MLFGRVCGYEDIEKLDMNWINGWKVRKGDSMQKIERLSRVGLINLARMIGKNTASLLF